MNYVEADTICCVFKQFYYKESFYARDISCWRALLSVVKHGVNEANIYRKF